MHASAEQTATPPHTFLPAWCRRLQKRILVPLPDAAARRAMLQGLLGGRLEAGVEVEGLVRDTEGYSGESLLVGCQGVPTE